VNGKFVELVVKGVSLLLQRSRYKKGAGTLLMPESR